MCMDARGAKSSGYYLIQPGESRTALQRKDAGADGWEFSRRGEVKKSFPD